MASPVVGGAIVRPPALRGLNTPPMGSSSTWTPSGETCTVAGAPPHAMRAQAGGNCHPHG